MLKLETLQLLNQYLKLEMIIPPDRSQVYEGARAMPCFEASAGSAQMELPWEQVRRVQPMDSISDGLELIVFAWHGMIWFSSWQTIDAWCTSVFPCRAL